MESSPREKQPIAEFKVAASTCREFMRKIAPMDMWPLLQAKGDWGGHLHRAILACALSEVSDDDTVDIVPGYVEALLADPKGRLYGDAKEQRHYAERLVSANVYAIDYEGFDNPLLAFERSQRYANVTEIPQELWQQLATSREALE